MAGGTASWLSLILGGIGGVVGSIVPGVGTALGAGLGSGVGAGIGGLFDNGSSDPSKLSDQEMIRKLAMSLTQSPIAGASGAFEGMAGQMASRGLSNSGVAGSAYGGLMGQLMGQRNQNQISASNLLSGIGQTPQSSAGQGGEILANLMPLLLQLGKGGK